MNLFTTDIKGDIQIEIDKFENEYDLQTCIEQHPESFPISELNPKACLAIPIGREVKTEIGNIDLLFLDDTGKLIIVECKLVENPQARREVCAQVMEYASRVQQWGYEDIRDAYLNYYQTDNENEIVKIFNRKLKKQAPKGDHVELTLDSLKKKIEFSLNDYLLVIAGDNLEQRALILTDYLRTIRSKGKNKFPIACVEFSRFKAKSNTDGKVSSATFITGTVRAACLLTTFSSQQRQILQKDDWVDLVVQEPDRSLRLELLRIAKEYEAQGKCKLVFKTKSLQICDSKKSMALFGLENTSVYFNFKNFEKLGFMDNFRTKLQNIVGVNSLGKGKEAAAVKYPEIYTYKDEVVLFMRSILDRLN
jgi:hypothetical protein